MKKIVFGFIIMVALIIMVVVSINALGVRMDLNKMTFGKLENQSVSIKEPVKDLKLDLGSAKIKIKKSHENSIHIKNQTKVQYEISQNNNSLVIKESDRKTHHILIGKTPEITIGLTSTDFDNFNIRQENGTLSLIDISAKQFDLKHQNGTTEASDLNLPNGGKFVKQNGASTINQLTTPALSVQIKTGKLTLDGKNKGNKFDDHRTPELNISNQTGQVKITRSK